MAVAVLQELLAEEDSVRANIMKMAYLEPETTTALTLRMVKVLPDSEMENVSETERTRAK